MEPITNPPDAAKLFATKLCGSELYQVVPGTEAAADFDALAARLGQIGKVTREPFTLSFTDGKYDIIIFQDCRAMIKHALDADNAKAVYLKYLGL